MFDRPGEKLKTLAIIDFVIMLIASVVLAFIYGKSGYRNELNIGLFLLIAVVGSLAGYISSLVLYAFGELIDSSQIGAHNSAELLRLLSSKESTDTSTSKWSPAKASLPQNYRMSACTDTEPQEWICPSCNTYNSKNSDVCKYCHRDRQQ